MVCGAFLKGAATMLRDCPADQLPPLDPATAVTVVYRASKGVILRKWDDPMSGDYWAKLEAIGPNATTGARPLTMSANISI